MNTIIKRKLFNSLRNHVEKKEISLIVGPRQVGKTTLMLHLKNELEKKGAKTLFLTLDNEANKQYFSAQSLLIKKIELELGKKHGYVFIDEIQRKENAGIFIKGIYDMNLPYKFIISGSGSLELKEKIHESLSGRKIIFELHPILFDEFVNYKTQYRYEKNLQDFFTIEKGQTENLLQEYLTYGGYPKIILEETQEEKRKYIDEIYHSYLEKDIQQLLKIERIDAFISMVKILSSQVGQLVNYSELSSSVGISLQTIRNYFWYGEKTFIFKQVSPFFRNMRKEITKSPIIYFYDLGLRNYTIGFFGNLDNPKESGLVFQNFIYNILQEKIIWSNASIHFWKTKDKTEVDFIIDLGKYAIPIEVKYKKLDQIKIERSLRSFIEKYKPVKAFVVNLSLNETITIEQTKVVFLPFWKLYELNFDKI